MVDETVARVGGVGDSVCEAIGVCGRVPQTGGLVHGFVGQKTDLC